MLSEIDKLLFHMEGYINHYVSGLEFEVPKYDPRVFTDTDFTVTNNYFEFNVFMNPLDVKNMKKGVVARHNPIVIRNKTLLRPKNIKLIFNAATNMCFLTILYDGCIFRERPTLISSFNLTNCEFM